MNLRTPFVNDYGRLRSGWRIVFFGLVFAAAVITADLLVLRISWRSISRGDQLLDLTRRILLLACALATGYVCARGLEGLPWRSLGLTFRTRWFRDLVLGSVVGFGSLLLAIAIAALAGGLSFTIGGQGLWWPMIRAVGGSAVLFAIAALAEEALFRGYPLQTLSRAHLAWLGVLLTSVPFAMAHLWNPNISGGITFANTTLAGLWLAIAYLRTRNLWFPLGVHWAWNWTLGSVFGLPVSGITFISHPLIQGQDHGPAWLTGGSYGIEGGAAGTVALILSSLFIWRSGIISPDPELLRLTSEELPAETVKGTRPLNEEGASPTVSAETF